MRDIIEEKIGDGYMFPMLGKWKSFDEIDFDSLPEEFVLKCNHDSGSVKVIRNKSALTDKDIESLRKFYNSRLKQDFMGTAENPATRVLTDMFCREIYERPVRRRGRNKRL